MTDRGTGGGPPALGAAGRRFRRRRCSAPMGVDGVYARTRLYEHVVDRLAALITDVSREPAAEVLRFPPVMSRRDLEKSGYLKSFPNLLGCVCACTAARRTSSPRSQPPRGRRRLDRRSLAPADLVLTPAACYPVYPLVARARRGAARRAAVRRRLRLFPPRAVARSRPAAIVPHARIRLHRHAGARSSLSARAGSSAARRSPASSACRAASPTANDPFFGREGQLMAVSQIQQALKFELLVPMLLGATADRVHELQLPPRPFRHDLGPAHGSRRRRAHRLRRLRHGPPGGRDVRDARHRAAAWPASVRQTLGM